MPNLSLTLLRQELAPLNLNPPWDEVLVKFLQHHEGLRLEPYRDPAGLWTIGFGHALEDKNGSTSSNAAPPLNISEGTAFHLLLEDIKTAHQAAVRAWQSPDPDTGLSHQQPFRLLPTRFRAGLTEMAFNLGERGLTRFQNFMRSMDRASITMRRIADSTRPHPADEESLRAELEIMAVQCRRHFYNPAFDHWSPLTARNLDFADVFVYATPKTLEKFHHADGDPGRLRGLREVLLQEQEEEEEGQEPHEAEAPEVQQPEHAEAGQVHPEGNVSFLNRLLSLFSRSVDADTGKLNTSRLAVEAAGEVIREVVDEQAARLDPDQAFALATILRGIADELEDGRFNR